MGHHDYGLAMLLIELLEHGHYFCRRVPVQVASGLIADQELWIRYDRSGYRHPLLLSAGQLSRQVVFPFRQAHQFQ